MTSGLEIRDLSVRYGEISAVRGLTLRADKGQIAGLFGANGAGKSTTLKAIMGLVRPERGAIVVNGQNVANWRAHLVARCGVALVPEGRRVFKRMSVRENLQVGGVTATRREVTQRLSQVYDLFPRLMERQHQLAGTLSGGEQQMLAIGRALMSRPSLVLYDEPSLGLAPMVTEAVFGVITRLSTEFGIGGVLVEQNVDVALDLVSQAYVLSRGELVISGPPATLRGSAELQEAYLGTLAPKAHP